MSVNNSSRKFNNDGVIGEVLMLSLVVDVHIEICMVLLYK